MAGHLLREIEAMNSLSAILLPLTQDECKRVLMWAEARFADTEETQTPLSEAATVETPAVTLAAAPQTPSNPSPDNSFDDYDYSFEKNDEIEKEEVVTARKDGTYADLSSFFAAVSPKTAIQKVATVAWWLEEQERLATWRTFDITKSMKLMGKPLKYISTTIAQERAKDIPFVEQLAKGEGQQGHGEYRLTKAGRDYINVRLKLGL